MKICPQCRTSYDDDSLSFCLQDGTPLAVQTASQSWNEPPETLVSPNARERIRVDVVPPSPPSQPNWTVAETATVIQPVKKSRTGLTVFVTIVLTLLTAGLAALGVMLYKRSNQSPVVRSDNKNVNIVVPANTNQNANANAAPTATATPAATLTPKPTLNPKEADRVKSDVRDVMENWKNASENLDLDGNMGNYAETVDYYNAGKVSAARVRADKQRAFEAYDSINFNLENVKITPDASGEKAVAVFDKEWNFESAEKTSTGKVQQQLTFAKVNGSWRITGEKDLKVYYTGK